MSVLCSSPAPSGAELVRLAESIRVRLTTLVEPLRLEDLFPAQQPLEVDLGCGDGAFLVGEAVRRPYHNFLGVERLKARIHKSCRKAARQQLSNVRVCLVESEYLVRYLLPPASVAIFHILFPDPWPKRRHAHHRLLRPQFFEFAAQALIEDGHIRLITDDAPYFRQAVAAGNSCSNLTPLAPFPADPERTMSTFERRFLVEGRAIHFACWKKISDAATSSLE